MILRGKTDTTTCVTSRPFCIDGAKVQQILHICKKNARKNDSYVIFLGLRSGKWMIDDNIDNVRSNQYPSSA